MDHLFIGGPVDGQRLPVKDGCLDVTVCDEPPFPVSTFSACLDPANVSMKTFSYTKKIVMYGKRKVYYFCHNVTDSELIKRIKKIND
jgi:hypothetical protein